MQAMRSLFALGEGMQSEARRGWKSPKEKPEGPKPKRNAKGGRKGSLAELAEEGEDVVEVYGGDCQVEEVVRKVATEMSLQWKMGQEERNIGVRVERLQGQVEVTRGLFRDLEREVEEIQQLLYAEVLFPMCDICRYSN